MGRVMLGVPGRRVWVWVSVKCECGCGSADVGRGLRTVGSSREWSMVHGLWSTVYSLRSMVYGLLYGPCSTLHGLWTGWTGRTGGECGWWAMAIWWPRTNVEG